MEILKSVEEIRSLVQSWKSQRQSIGLVPTMGALHEGHLSLIAQSRQNCDKTIASVFVNPTQFGPTEDFDQYPRTVEADCKALEAAGCHAVFLPTPQIMYPEGFDTWVTVGGPADTLEGILRPVHFKGVATVCLKLFNLSQADMAFFGQKDFQQVQVIRRMVADLNVPIKIVRCPIVREPNGLARSSRNRYLSESEKTDALCLSRSLKMGKRLAEEGTHTANEVKRQMEQVILAIPNSQLDYVRLADGETLAEIPGDQILQSSQQAGRELVALIAARIGATRLIDNAIL